jgi:hypothetical protein
MGVAGLGALENHCLPPLIESLGVKVWGSLAIYAHHITGGLTVELEMPVVIWLAAAALSWRDFHPPQKGLKKP